jgi:hypothetical protein
MHGQRNIKFCFTMLVVPCVFTKLLSTSWSNTMHILLQSSYAHTVKLYWHLLVVATTIMREYNTTEQKTSLLGVNLVMHTLSLFCVPLQQRAVYVTPPSHAWSAVLSGLEVPLDSAYACTKQKNALNSWVHCSSIDCPFNWYSCTEEQCTPSGELTLSVSSGICTT